MGTDCSTPITRFFPFNFEKTRVFGVPCIWCEIRKIGQRVIHVESTFTGISVRHVAPTTNTTSPLVKASHVLLAGITKGATKTH